MKRGVWQPLFAGADNLEQAVLQKRRFPSADTEFCRRRINERDSVQHFLHAPVVVDVARRLRTHQAQTVAAIGREKCVVSRRAAVQRADMASWIDTDNVAFGEMANAEPVDNRHPGTLESFGIDGIGTEDSVESFEVLNFVPCLGHSKAARPRLIGRRLNLADDPGRDAVWSSVRR